MHVHLDCYSEVSDGEMSRQIAAEEGCGVTHRINRKRDLVQVIGFLRHRNAVQSHSQRKLRQVEYDHMEGIDMVIGDRQTKVVPESTASSGGTKLTAK